MAVKPIRPEQVPMIKQKDIPEPVLEAFNELIIKNFRGDGAVLRQADLVALMVQKGLNKEDIFANSWLDVEPLYRAAGWSVEYDKPAAGEGDYPPTFIFAFKKKKR